jgi:hypothetical protein
MGVEVTDRFVVGESWTYGVQPALMFVVPPALGLLCAVQALLRVDMRWWPPGFMLLLPAVAIPVLLAANLWRVDDDQDAAHVMSGALIWGAINIVAAIAGVILARNEDVPPSRQDATEGPR